MNSYTTEADIINILTKLKDGQNDIISCLDAIDQRLTNVESKVDLKIPDIEKKLKSLERQNVLIWSLIAIQFTAIAVFTLAILKNFLIFY